MVGRQPKLPNILITGTPGTGKTTTCASIAEATGATHINVSELVKTEDLHSGWDDEFDSFVLNEDKACIFIHAISIQPAGNSG